jgi:arsenate reductase
MSESISVTIYHNPSCGTSRNVLALIQNAGIKPTVIDYLKTPPDRATLELLIGKMSIRPRDLLRQKGTPYEELGLAAEHWTDAQLIDQMLAHPILINRPIVITPWGVKLCRPSQVVLDILPLPQHGPFAKEDGELLIDDRRRRVSSASNERDSELVIRPTLPDDAEQIAEIYNHYVRTSAITFEETAVSAPEMAGRILEIQSSPLPWLTAVKGARIVGYAYAGKWKTRSAYRFSTEVTVYVGPGLEGTGVGSALYRQLLASLESSGVHAVIAGIALPNHASTRLHEKFGFKKVAHFQEVGFKFDRWVDVAYWQLVL